MVFKPPTAVICVYCVSSVYRNVYLWVMGCCGLHHGVLAPRGAVEVVGRLRGKRLKLTELTRPAPRLSPYANAAQ